jgi:hypothetical protein
MNLTVWAIPRAVRSMRSSPRTIVETSARFVDRSCTIGQSRSRVV